MKLKTLVLLACIIGAVAWYTNDHNRRDAGSFGPGADEAAALTSAAPAFRCEGKTHCSQMSSCDEAKFYINNCPATEMDGDGDGVPCESQWCGK